MGEEEETTRRKPVGLSATLLAARWTSGRVIPMRRRQGVGLGGGPAERQCCRLLGSDAEGLTHLHVLDFLALLH